MLNFTRSLSSNPSKRKQNLNPTPLYCRPSPNPNQPMTSLSGSALVRDWRLIAGFLLLAGCATLPPPSKPPPPSVQPPKLLEKTFGEVNLQKGAAQAISYKNMLILIDPYQSDPSQFRSADYVLLTDVSPSHWDAGLAQSNPRKDLKIICPSDGVSTL